MNSVNKAPMVHTQYGWALASLTPPSDRMLLWVKMPERHIYDWEDGQWIRVAPPERPSHPIKDLDHG